MPEPFKNFISEELITGMACHLGIAWPAFPRERFIANAQRNLEELELKQRSNQIVTALERHLPSDFEQAAAVLRASLPGKNKPGLSGWAIMPLNDYIGRAGQEHFDTAMDLLRDITSLFTSEFGVRHFLIANQSRALEQMVRWSKSKNFHVRRLASEGCRPRLPWAMRLPELVKDPRPILPILTTLRDDPEEYVRRSVANNLNDISKDHPDLVANTAADWMTNASKDRKRLIRHACRSLLKQGHGTALGVFGFDKPEKVSAELQIQTPVLTLGSELKFELSLNSTARQEQKLMIDYVVHHMKANGKQTPKVFKWKTTQIEAGAHIAIGKRHAIRPITTRRYYAGQHRLEIMVNGTSVAMADFILSI
ncbi:DNA alkylation repair protein [Pelagibius sp. Alg239-R121]|uniref:DNA alkylation repair protein n=1 Tax=Pelagibius sp. Alg239-R121 TaxID=2993448 RepID=UPI0024A64622|nr:DNA alkylation repair protein [Pelagibius sp. Alg239-R121]